MNSLVQRKPFLMSLKGSDGCSEVAEPGVFPFPENAFISIPRSHCHLRCFWNPWFSSSERSFLLWRVKCHIRSWSHGRKDLLQGKNPQWLLIPPCPGRLTSLKDHCWGHLRNPRGNCFVFLRLHHFLACSSLICNECERRLKKKKPLKVNSVSFSK